MWRRTGLPLDEQVIARYNRSDGIAMKAAIAIRTAPRQWNTRLPTG
jgi:hypothetical protein